MLSRSVPDVEPSGSGSKSRRANSGQCRAERAWVDVESYEPGQMLSSLGLMSNRSVLGRCRVVQTQADVESSGSRLMSSRSGSGRFRFVRVWVNVESLGPGSMLSRLGSGRFWVIWARVDVKLSVLTISSGPGPGRCWAELVCVLVKSA